MLSIVFANRNQTYGAYQLRRSYPQTVGRALVYGFGLIILFFLIPYLSSRLSGAAGPDERVDEGVTIVLEPARDIDPVVPPPKPLPSLPPPSRSTQKFVPPVIKNDADVADDLPITLDELIKTPIDIGATTQQGNDDLPPALDGPSPEVFVEMSGKQSEVDTIYESYGIHKPPSFPGGDRDLLKFLSQNIVYPPLARENNIQGQVVLSFVVGEDGKVQDITILKDIGGGCGKEAVRVVKSMPLWIPGEANGHAVKVRYVLPVRFELR